VFGAERFENCRWRQPVFANFEDRDVDLAAGIHRLTPEGCSRRVQGKGEPRRSAEVVAIDVKFNLDAIREMPAWYVGKYVTARDKKEVILTCKKEAACIRQVAQLAERSYSGGGEQERLNCGPAREVSRRSPGHGLVKKFPQRAVLWSPLSRLAC
jgi:hypothetical protein